MIKCIIDIIIKKEDNMANNVRYNSLFKLLIDRNEKKTEFAKGAGINLNTLAKLSKNEYVSMAVLVRICRYLNCQISDIVEVIMGEQEYVNEQASETDKH